VAKTSRGGVENMDLDNSFFYSSGGLVDRSNEMEAILKFPKRL